MSYKQMINLFKRNDIKITYIEKINKYYVKTDEKDFFIEPLNLAEYIDTKNSIKILCEATKYSKVAKDIDPNVWRILKIISNEDVCYLGTEFDYMKAIGSKDKLDEIPFKMVYNINYSEKYKGFNPVKKLIFKNMKRMQEIQAKASNKFLEIGKIDEKKHERLMQLKQEKQQLAPQKKKNNVLKKIGASVVAFVAGVSAFASVNNNNNKVNEEKNNNTLVDFQDSMENDTTSTTFTMGNYDVTVMDTSTTSLETTAAVTTMGEKEQDSIDAVADTIENTEVVSTSQEENEMNKIKPGDRIKIVSDDAKYYVDSFGNGIAYSFEDLKEEYGIQDVIAEYVTGEGVVHGVGITSDGDQIHFGWFGKDVVLEKNQDSEIENNDVQDYER